MHAAGQVMRSSHLPVSIVPGKVVTFEHPDNTHLAHADWLAHQACSAATPAVRP